MDATDRWREILKLREDELPLDEAAMLIGAHANPYLDVAAQLRRLDDVAARLGDGDTDRVCRMLFGTLGLRGDTQTYDDPRNSYLDQVLNRRLGIPISLSVLLIEVGRRCGAMLEGVGLPGHFLVRDRSSPTLLIDPFSGGRRIDRAGCEELLRAVAGPEATLGPEMLERTGPRATLARMLTNLDRSFGRREDRRSLAWVTRLRIAIPGCPVRDRLELARRAASLGWHDQAADLLQEVAGRPGLGAETAERLRRRSLTLRASLN
ncbi:MAG TPA: transglutaminase-like domain-containing protein [Acidimicrobiales bacterium]|nr:transglutaminase-like domain-containing protein [Acidimicrobiales bacterium]